MTIELPALPSKALNRLVKSGAYSSPTEAVAEALRVLQDLSDGAQQISLRKLSPFDAETATRIKERGRKILASERRGDRPPRS